MGRQRHRGQLQPDLLQGGHGHASANTCSTPATRRPQRAAWARRPATRRSTRAWSTSSTPTTPTPALWTAAPSDPTPATLFSAAPPTPRPATAYIALRQILGKDNFTAALQQIQRDYRHSSITEKQLEAEYHAFLPNQSAACQRPARPVLHPVVRHRLPARRRGEPAAAHRPRTGRAGLLQPGRHLRLSLIG